MPHREAPDPGAEAPDVLPPGIKTTRLIARAAREGWPIGDELRARALQHLANVLDDDWVPPDGVARPGYREREAAWRALASFSRINLAQQALDLRRADDAAGLTPDVVAQAAALARARRDRRRGQGRAEEDS